MALIFTRQVGHQVHRRLLYRSRKVVFFILLLGTLAAVAIRTAIQSDPDFSGTAHQRVTRLTGITPALTRRLPGGSSEEIEWLSIKFEEFMREFLLISSAPKNKMDTAYHHQLISSFRTFIEDRPVLSFYLLEFYMDQSENDVRQVLALMLIHELFSRKYAVHIASRYHDSQNPLLSEYAKNITRNKYLPLTLEKQFNPDFLRALRNPLRPAKN